MLGDPIFYFDRSLSLSFIYVLRKIKENLYCGSLIFFNFSALASSTYAAIVAARCSQKSILDIFQLTSTEAMSSCEGRFVKIGVVFHALYFENEVGDPPIFCISDIGNSLSDCRQSMKKICIVEVFRANVLKSQIITSEPIPSKTMNE